ncbi:MAG: hypothetical protein E7468_01635 [Ruminococcaceae bacterium]|nr:hypothetical protein [Oscillospiraceae bacterium]
MKTYEERMQSVQGKLKKKQTQRKALMATAGMLCLCIVAGLLLPKGSNEGVPVEPGIDISQYSDSQYFKVIEAISRDLPDKAQGLTWEEYMQWDQDNNEDVLFQGDAPSNGSSANTSIEITDHQVAGVHEGDLIKRSETHIFYFDGYSLNIYSIDGSNSHIVSSWNLKRDIEAYYNSPEIYLSADASRVTLLIPGDKLIDNCWKNFVKIVLLDVQDPEHVIDQKTVYLTGSLISSRMVGDQLMVMTRYSMKYQVDFDDESSYLPQYGTPEDMNPIPAENIVVPEQLTSDSYTVINLLDTKDLSVTDAGAFMSYSRQLYVSRDNIYVTRGYTDKEEIAEHITATKSMTEIACVGYGENGLTLKGTFCVEGTIKNQYSMDEHNGVFRIVTGTNRRYRASGNTNPATDAYGNTAPPVGEPMPLPPTYQNANLTCFEVDTWEKLAEVKDFAPEGETVESVRFDGDYAYVCTAVVVTLRDPVFFFDMTDLGNITVKDTGTIEGYSSSLIQLKDGYLMGIGFDEKRCLKVEVYQETENGVTSVCSYVKDARFATDYKAYYIDRENNLFGIPTYDGYVLLQFTGSQLRELRIGEIKGILDQVRGVVIDDFLYVFSPDRFDLKPIYFFKGDDAELLGLKENGKLLVAMVADAKGKYQYSFTENDANIVAAYFSSLDLTTDFENKPQQSAYIIWNVTLIYENGDTVCFIYDAGGFVKAQDDTWYKITDEPSSFGAVLKELNNK